MKNVIVKNRVRELRKRLNLRQSDLAGEIGVSRQTILAIEKERLNPSILLSLKIARALGQSADYVFFLSPNGEETLGASASRDGSVSVPRVDESASAQAPVWKF